MLLIALLFLAELFLPKRFSKLVAPTDQIESVFVRYVAQTNEEGKTLGPFASGETRDELLTLLDGAAYTHKGFPLFRTDSLDGRILYRLTFYIPDLSKNTNCLELVITDQKTMAVVKNHGWSGQYAIHSEELLPFLERLKETGVQ